MSGSNAHKSIGVRLTVAATGLSVSACSLALAPPRIVAGQRFSESNLVGIERGTPADELQRVGGAPFEKRTTEAGETWRYFMTVEQREHVKFLNVVPMPTRRALRTVEVVFSVREGRVADVTSRDSGGDR
jgi:hypothetical protein